MTTDDPSRLPRQVAGPLRLTLLGLWAERLTRAFWPLWTVILGTLAALAFGLQDSAQIELVWISLVLAALGAVWALVSGLRRFRRPTRDQAIARLDATLPGRPLAALTDSQAIGSDDPASQAVWQVHLARMAARARAARPVAPDLNLAPRDPFALRYVALTAFVLALMFGSLWRVASVTNLAPGGTSAAAAGPTWEGWAQPPIHTGKPALYLPDQKGDALTLPVGSKIQIQLYGQVGDLTLAETVSARTDAPPASDAAQTFLVAQSGSLRIAGPGGRSFDITALPDAAPTVTPEGEITRKADGRFTQKFSARDDYGITKGSVTIALDLAQVDRRHGLATDPEPRDPVTLDLPLPVTGNRADFTETLVDDLSQHPFANLPVTMTFSVSDAAGQTGTSAPYAVTLPGKRFFDPLAAALIELRRDLLWSRANAPRSAQILRALTNKPESLIRNERAYLRLRVLTRNLAAAPPDLTAEARDAFAQELWQIALLVEEGDLASAQERLRRAQDRLDEAIRNGASPEEIDELMQEMRQALNDYMKELGEQAQRNPDGQLSQNMQGMELSGDQLQKMLDELQQAMREGRTADAQQMMEMLRQLMENMQVVQGEGQGQGGPGQQAMRDLQDTLRQQQGLSDDTFRDLQGNPQPGEGEGEGEGQNPGSLSDRQGELQRRLGELQGGQLPGDGQPTGEEGRRQLDRAGRAMDEAERALRDGDLSGALDQQAEAMEALRQGLQNFGEAQAQAQRDQGSANQGTELGQADPNAPRDPLGREPGNAARIGSDHNMLQGPDIYRRAQDLLDEIRRRSGEQSRPAPERDYLRRLLDLF